MNGRDSIALSEPQSRTQQSAVDSSLPPLSPSPSSLHHQPLRSMNLSPPLLRGSSSSAHVEDNKKPSSPPSGVKRRAGKNIEPLSRHHRSVSVDSCFSNFLELPLSPGVVSSTSSADGDYHNTLDLKFGKDEYTADELEKISKSDPKKVRRILANRESAARSKKRKSQYLLDLEHQVNFLEKDITLMQEKEMLLENAKNMLINEKKEFMIRLESLEQQAKLHDEIKSPKATTTLNEQLSVEAQQLTEVLASNEQLSVEVQRLKMAIGDVMHNDGYQIDLNMLQQLTINESDQPQTSKQP
ncbi:PREDICTED: transcription factor VIP1-like [Camelina sativa]|uniref:Transcription factor VIP1-like n=1 Tax=Camelina sativa TaxID=90675 RepID=A0ABM0TE46_CAMSA|nr:PREDICTED: transcription factor VIP1-like [Camelina sativa]